MPCIAYFANVFPCSVEPYVIEEIGELRRCGVTVIPSSVRRARLSPELQTWAAQTLYIEPLRFGLLLHAGWLFFRCFRRLKTFLMRALVRRSNRERRVRVLLHTFLGVYCAVLLGKQGVEHIHVHHGYFGSWVAMVAAQVLGIPFSMTLHGSDLLVHAAYLDIKLKHCQFCVTVSQFNQRHILKRYPDIDPAKIHVRRIGVDCRLQTARVRTAKAESAPLLMLAVGRLHAVKDHAFLVRACEMLKNRGLQFACSIAGGGPERHSLERLIRDLKLQREIRLLGELAHDQIDEQYQNADLIVLTSRSEGVPLVLMEAMARGKLVLAPAITGIPELVVDGKTGFLYQPGSLAHFVAQIELINRVRFGLTDIRRNAREHVLQHFDREKNVAAFCELLLLNLRARAAEISTAA
jgi:colanic acid/amylovoran biosynthesis glycosyltransferase